MLVNWVWKEQEKISVKPNLFFEMGNKLTNIYYDWTQEKRHKRSERNKKGYNRCFIINICILYF